MEIKKIIFTISLFILLLQIVSATEIKIQTLPNHEVQITLITEIDGESIVLERLEGLSDENGDVSFGVDVESNFDLLVFVKKDGKTVLSEKHLENYSPNEEIVIEILSETQENLVSDSGDFNPSFLYILFGIVVIIIIFFIFRKVKRKSKPKEPRIIKLSELVEQGKATLQNGKYVIHHNQLKRSTGDENRIKKESGAVKVMNRSQEYLT
ncbi:MAG: hypothetical protein IIA87_05865 [Nanoarchaeota archaeon]|nr:hypothetical protein [Nanoarchaeota archaeon]